MDLEKLSELKWLAIQSPADFGDEHWSCFYKIFDEIAENFSTDSLERRLSIIVIERMLRHRWQEKNFRQVEFSKHLENVLSVFAESSSSITFSKRFLWFGDSYNLHNTRNSCSVKDCTEMKQCECERRNSLSYFATCLMMRAMCKDMCGIRLFALALVKHFKDDLEELTDKLMENDERLLFVLLCLLIVYKCNGKDDVVLDPIVMFGIFLRKVDFDTSVVVDWLQSECVAVPFILCLLKTILNLSEADLDTIFGFLDRMKFKSGRRAAISQVKCKESGIQLSVKEIHGEKIVDRKYTITESVTRQSLSMPHDRTKYSSFKGNFTLFLTSLRSKLENYETKQLFPFSVKPILKVLSKLCE